MKTGTAARRPAVSVMSRLSRHRARTAGPSGRGAPAPDVRLEQGFERSFVPVALVDLEGRFLRVNRRPVRVPRPRGGPRSWGAASWPSRIPTTSSVTNDATRQLSIGGRQHAQVEKRYVRPDGSAVWGLAAATLIAVDGDAYRYVQIQDISDRKAAEQRLEELLEEHGALARVARAVATGATPDTVYALVAREVARLMRGDVGAVIRFEGDGYACALATHEEPGHTTVPAGTRYELDGRSAAAVVAATGRAVRIDGYDADDSGIGGVLARNGHSSGVSAPIHVDGRLWGALAMATSRPELLQPRRSRAPGAVRRARGRRGRQRERARGAGDARVDRSADRPAEPRRVPRAGRGRCSPARGRTAHAASCCSTSTTSRRSTTTTATRPATRVLARVAAARGRQRPRGRRAGPRGRRRARVAPPRDRRRTRRGRPPSARARPSRAAELRTPSGGVLTISAGVCATDQATAAAELFRLADGALYWAKCHGRNTTVCYRSEVVEASPPPSGPTAWSARRRWPTHPRPGPGGRRASDPHTQRHSERVADLAASSRSRWAGRWSEAAQLRDAGLVHDVGKIGIPDAILLKPGRLTREEYEQVKAHAALGAQIVNDVLLPEQVAWVRHHHERWDGAGYPDGLAGEDIPVGARILPWPTRGT